MPIFRIDVFRMLFVLAMLVCVFSNALNAEKLSSLVSQFHHGSGLLAMYFNGTNHEELKVTRVDPTVDFNWGEGSPDPEVNVDNFTGRWLGYLVPRYSETYTFTIAKDDGARLWIGDTKLIDSWDGCGSPSATITLEANKFYPIKVEFVEYGGGACISMYWASAHQPQEVVPAVCLYPEKPANVVIAVADTDDLQKGILSLLDDDFTPKAMATPGCGEPSVSTSGQVAFAVGWHSNWSDPKITKNTELYLTGPDGGNMRHLKGTSYGENTPAFSADGKRMAFSSNRGGSWQIFTMNTDAGQQTQVTHSAGENSRPAFSPTGGWLVYQSKRDGKWGLYRIDIKGGEETLLADQGDNVDACVSPDGEHILFSSNRDGKYHVYSMNADGSEAKRLTETKESDDTHPCYVSTGTAIGFLSTRNGKGGDLYLMATDGSNPRRLTTCGGICDFAWNL